MSTERISSDRVGFVNPTKLPRGPNGLPLCRWCNKEIPVSTGRKTFCSDDCVSSHKVLTDPGHVRRLVLERDHGVCAVCGLDTDALQRILTSEWMVAGEIMEVLMRKAAREDVIARLRGHGWSERAAEASFGHWAEFDAKIIRGKLHRSLWAADHIKPVVEGGGGCGLDNYRTLCVPCHNKASAALAKRRASARKRQRELPGVDNK